MKVWVAFTGDYSERNEVAAFASRELAERYLETRGLVDKHEEGDDRFDITEFEVIESLVDPVVSIYCMTTVTEHGAEPVGGEHPSVLFPGIDQIPAPLRAVPCAEPRWGVVYPPGGGTVWRKEIHIATEGTDHERVRKSHSERVAQAVAEFDVLAASLGEKPEWAR